MITIIAVAPKNIIRLRSAIETEAPFHVYKADDGTVVGPVVGLTPGAITIAAESGATEVPFEQVQAVPRDAGPEANWLSRRAVESPWYSGHADFSFASFDGTTHTTALLTGFGVERERSLGTLGQEPRQVHARCLQPRADAVPIALAREPPARLDQRWLLRDSHFEAQICQAPVDVRLQRHGRARRQRRDEPRQRRWAYRRHLDATFELLPDEAHVGLRVRAAHVAVEGGDHALSDFDAHLPDVLAFLGIG